MTNWWHKLVRPTPPKSGAVDEPSAIAQALDDVAAAACGWHESSWDLKRGLAVAEVSELELAIWDLVNGAPAPA
jgi:hypothetical protein